VSDHGRVKSSHRVLKIVWNCVSGHGRVSIRLDGDKKPSHLYVHSLVLGAFVGIRPTPSHQCRHLDGNPQNNVLSNLKWGTASEQRLDDVAHGKSVQANKVVCSRGHKLTPRYDRPGQRRCQTCDRAYALVSSRRKRGLVMNVDQVLAELSDSHV
jgi:HNH endonuclease